MSKQKESAILLAIILLIGNGVFFWIANMIDGQLTLFGLSMFFLGFISAKTFMRSYFNFKNL